ncbi:hypothetical protein GCM10027268_23700 [Brachybacterium huguangmaarense]
MAGSSSRPDPRHPPPAFSLPSRVTVPARRLRGGGEVALYCEDHGDTYVFPRTCVEGLVPHLRIRARLRGSGP